MERMPYVSIIVPVYNGEKTIRDCVESLLRQDYPKDKYEIIVVDNNSKDKTAQIVKRFPVRYVEEKALQSAYAARNKGIEKAKGDIIAFIDSDCTASGDWLKKGIEGFIDTSTGCVAGIIRGYKPQTYVEKYLCKRNMISQAENTDDMPFPYAKTANAFYNKVVFGKIGLFEEKWISAGDADFGWRMLFETDYKITFSRNATVFHRHRSTVRKMFEQCVKWGIGYTLLCKKYKDKMPKRNIGQIIWILWRLTRNLPHIMIFCLRRKDVMAEAERDGYLDLIAFTGWEAGRILGSARNRVFAV